MNDSILSPEAKKSAIAAIDKDLSFLEDNCYRYKLDDGGTGRHKDTIFEHQTQISTLKQARAVLLALSVALLLALSPLSASASLRPTANELHANAECARLGAFVERHGLTKRETAMMRRHHCVKIFTGDWYSTRYPIDVVG